MRKLNNNTMEFRQIISQRPEKNIGEKLAGFAGDWGKTNRTATAYWYGQIPVTKTDLYCWRKFSCLLELIAEK